MTKYWDRGKPLFLILGSLNVISVLDLKFLFSYFISMTWFQAYPQPEVVITLFICSVFLVYAFETDIVCNSKNGPSDSQQYFR